ncbi:hypothetical protein [Frankia gtarii]|uniref:hypothetical protein n=1 Tax=Frankia gtarii TaxID=2950102 RepID=UPI0021BF5872|nr:hypothetical protein [Frankia gtarii]
MWGAFVHGRAEHCRQAGHVVVAGVVNVQQTVSVDGFPLACTPVSPATLVGDDPAGLVIRSELRRLGLLGEDGSGRGAGVLPTAHSAMSAVLVDPHGTRQVHTDLAGLAMARYPPPVFDDLRRSSHIGCSTGAAVRPGSALRSPTAALDADEDPRGPGRPHGTGQPQGGL